MASSSKSNKNKSDSESGSGKGDGEIPSCFVDTHGVVTSTMNDVPGYRVLRVLGAVYGLTVRSRNWGSGLGAVAMSTVGGELRTFTKLMYTARNEALERLVGECLARGGNAIVALRFDIDSFGGCAQVCAYGTACVVDKIATIEDDAAGKAATAAAA